MKSAAIVLPNEWYLARMHTALKDNQLFDAWLHMTTLLERGYKDAQVTWREARALHKEAVRPNRRTRKKHKTRKREQMDVERRRATARRRRSSTPVTASTLAAAMGFDPSASRIACVSHPHGRAPYPDYEDFR